MNTLVLPMDTSWQRKVATPPAFRVVVADPPWQPEDELPGDGRGAAKHYPTMPTRDIEALAFRLPRIADDALLFLWRLASMPFDGLDVVRAWGFRPVSEIVWVKLTKDGRVRQGMGHYVRCAHETCIIAARGKAASLILAKNVPSVLHARRSVHSRKPAEFFDMVEKLAGGPYLELFGRQRRAGWTVVGNELGERMLLPLE